LGTVVSAKSDESRDLLVHTWRELGIAVGAALTCGTVTLAKQHLELDVWTSLLFTALSISSGITVLIYAIRTIVRAVGANPDDVFRWVWKKISDWFKRPGGPGDGDANSGQPAPDGPPPASDGGGNVSPTGWAIPLRVLLAAWIGAYSVVEAYVRNHPDAGELEHVLRRPDGMDRLRAKGALAFNAIGTMVIAALLAAGRLIASELSNSFTTDKIALIIAAALVNGWVGYRHKRGSKLATLRLALTTAATVALVMLYVVINK
jgi:hypothetical protein